jgi:hypothetical protein
VYAQEQEMKLLHAQIAELQDKMAQAKRHMLITAIKNETIKKMVFLSSIADSKRLRGVLGIR